MFMFKKICILLIKDGKKEFNETFDVSFYAVDEIWTIKDNYLDWM